MFATRIYMSMRVYMAEYGHIYPYMYYFGAQEVPKTYSQCISHLGSWCTLHQADTAIVQCHPTSMHIAGGFWAIILSQAV